MVVTVIVMMVHNAVKSVTGAIFSTAVRCVRETEQGQKR
jgi:hypothetical protein